MIWGSRFASWPRAVQPWLAGMFAFLRYVRSIIQQVRRKPSQSRQETLSPLLDSRLIDWSIQNKKSL
jgi:hypothetical protein